ncbi:MAG: rhomboid family intramembrane serine protease, partial [Sulfitobacter dubius]
TSQNWPDGQCALDRACYMRAARSKALAPNWPTFAPPQWPNFTPPLTLGAALVVGVLYGSILWGVLPGQPGVSWEAHLFGAIAGAVAAVLVGTHVHAPRLGGVDLE